MDTCLINIVYFFYVFSLFIIKISLFEKRNNFRNAIWLSNSLCPDRDQDPNCLLMISAYYTCRQRLRVDVVFRKMNSISRGQVIILYLSVVLIKLDV